MSTVPKLAPGRMRRALENSGQCFIIGDMNILTTQNEFSDFLMELATSGEYQYKFLKHELANIFQGRSPIYDDSLLNVQGDSWILIVHGDTIMIHGHNWSVNQFTEIREAFDLSRFNNYLLRGDAVLIRSLNDFYGIRNFDVEMERLFYRTNAIKLFPTGDLVISQAREEDLAQLAPMMQMYYHEEYNGENDKTIEESTARARKCLVRGMMYVLRNAEGTLLSFCTVNDPDIGILFTKQEFRNRGCGKMILSYCGELLLQKNDEAYLMTVASQPASNAACQQVGFRQYFEYGYVRINIHRQPT
jgi:Predicted acetyltransferase